MSPDRDGMFMANRINHQVGVPLGTIGNKSTNWSGNSDLPDDEPSG